MLMKAMPTSAKPKRRPARRPLPPPKPYHHGDLKRVLIDAALGLVEEGGVEAVSVREEAQRRFRAEIEAALSEAPAGDPLARFRSFGLAYLRWAMRNPAHFEIISSGRFFDHDKATGLSQDNAELIGMTERLLADAFGKGQLRIPDLKRVQIAGRALVYGFARMNIDGHLPRWGVAEADAERTAEAILDLFIEGISTRPGHGLTGKR